MKEFDNIVPIPEELKIVNQKEIDKHKELFNSFTKYKGHIVYEINCVTGEIREAEYKNERIEFVDKYDLIDLLFASVQKRKPSPVGQTPITKRDIDSKENCLYVPALNIKSAKKKFLKYLMKNARAATTKK